MNLPLHIHRSRPRRTLIAWTLVLLAGCGWLGAKGRPDWVTGTSRAFPQDQFVTGLGEGESVTSATEHAYAAVARVFKAEISSEAMEWESYLLVENRGRSQDERRLTLDHVTNVTTDKVLENVQVLDKWHDTRRRRYFVFAGISRAQAESSTLSRLADLDRTVNGQVDDARQTRDKLTKLRQLKRAARTLVLREAYNTDLRVIRLNGQGIAAPYRVAELAAELEQAATTVPIGLELTGDHVEPIGRAVSEGLLRHGLTVVGETTGRDATAASGSSLTAELILKGRVQVWPIEVRDPQFHYVRWCSDFVLLEPSTRRVVGALSRGDKVGHVSSQEAEARALRSIQQEFTSDLSKTVADYVYGDSDQANTPATSGACPRNTGSASKNPA